MIEVRIDRIPDKEWDYKETAGGNGRVTNRYWYIDDKRLYAYTEVIHIRELEIKGQEQEKRLFRRKRAETRRIKTKKFYKKFYDREEFSITTGELKGVTMCNPFPEEVWKLIRDKYMLKEKIYRDEEEPLLRDERHAAGKWIWEVDKKY